jgi:hypothetical protein
MPEVRKVNYIPHEQIAVTLVPSPSFTWKYQTYISSLPMRALCLQIPFGSNDGFSWTLYENYATVEQTTFTFFFISYY